MTLPPVLSVRNLARYQHYKNRRPPWIKLYQTLLEDDDLMCLPDATKWLAVGLLLLASRNNNRIITNPERIKNALSLSTEPDLNALFDAGFLVEPHKVAKSPRASKSLAECEQDAMALSTEIEIEKDTTTTKTAAPKKPARKAAEPKVLTPRARHPAQPLADAWDQKFGTGTFPWPKHARAIAALGEMPSDDWLTLGAAFARYLAETDRKFASLPSFLAKRLSYLEPQESGEDRDVAYAVAHGGIWDYERGQLTDAGDLITNPDREQERSRKVGAWRR